MNTLTSILSQWQQKLSELYDEREITQLLAVVLEDLFGWSRQDQLLRKQEELSEATTAALAVVLGQLETGEPVQHIIGFTWFDGLKISVNPDVLIPRPETEELVNWVYHSVDWEAPVTIMDWCSGSGCIALALKERLPQSTVIAYELSPEAIEIAKQNATNLDLEVAFQLRDALDPESDSQKADVIVSNPPYIPESDKEAMHLNVLGFDPQMALFVPDETPLLFYKAITWHALRELKGSGWLFFELHPDFADATRDLVIETNGFERVEIREDLYGRKRMLRARRKPQEQKAAPAETA